VSVGHIELPHTRVLPVNALAGRASLPELLRRLLIEPLDVAVAEQPGLEEQLIEDARALGERAYPGEPRNRRRNGRTIDHRARKELHWALLLLYQQHMRLPHVGMSINQFHPLVCRLMGVLEGPWERDMLARARTVVDLSADTLPSDPDAFVRWYRTTAFAHPLYEHELYSYLASDADRPALEWFFGMEAAGEAGFDDLVALAQVGTRGGVKIEMGRNYWDELGNGRPHAVHTHLFHRLIDDLALVVPTADALPWQVLASANVMLWSCIPRRNAFRAQGALGAVELLAPQRCTRVVHGALRVGITKPTVSYYAAHAIIDVGHAEGWLDHVVRGTVRAVPESRTEIAEGLVCRADASVDYFDFCLAAMRCGGSGPASFSGGGHW
jgi:hypothetical protein